MNLDEFNKLSSEKQETIKKIIDTLGQEGLDLRGKEINVLIDCLNNGMTVEEARAKLIKKINLAQEGLKKLDKGRLIK